MTRRGERATSKRPSTARAVRWTERARCDLQEIGDYIAEDDPRAADRWVQRLFERAERAAALPLAGRRVPEIGRDDVREVFLRTYRLVYRVLDASIDILTVLEGHRRFPADVADEEGAQD